MSKQVIGRVFLGSVAAFVASLLLGGAAVMVVLSRDVFIMNGPDVVGVRPGSGAWGALILAVLALFLAIGSAVGGFVAWLGVLAATSSRTDKTWFVVLLVLGLLSIGFFATLIYLVAGPPDESEAGAPNVERAGQRQPTPIAH